MNDKELADKVVALGIAEQDRGFPDRFYIPNVSGALFTDELVRDWRVAGALMEKACPVEYAMLYLSKLWGAWPENGDGTVYESESLPRAIIEACVEALS